MKNKTESDSWMGNKGKHIELTLWESLPSLYYSLGQLCAALQLSDLRKYQEIKSNDF